ncbi:MAG: PIN domain-containing protein [Nitrososphaerales archaeon]
MNSELSGSTVFDTSVLLELAIDSPMSRQVRDNVLTGQVQAMTGELNITELGYLLCRKSGKEQATKTVGYLRRANQVRILASASFLDQAAEMKCGRSMSLVDCVTVAMGELLGAPVLFAKHERELDLEMKKTPFKTKLHFMEESWSPLGTSAP